MEDTTKVTYRACRWNATWGLFLLGGILGYLNNRDEDLALAMGAGLMLAPLNGLFWG